VPTRDIERDEKQVLAMHLQPPYMSLEPPSALIDNPAAWLSVAVS
jgi:hypothetical protein